MWVYIRGEGGRYEYIICKINSHQKKRSFCLESTSPNRPKDGPTANLIYWDLGNRKTRSLGGRGGGPLNRKNRTVGAPYVGTPLVKKIVEEAEDEELQTVTDFR